MMTILRAATVGVAVSKSELSTPDDFIAPAEGTTPEAARDESAALIEQRAFARFKP